MVLCNFLLFGGAWYLTNLRQRPTYATKSPPTWHVCVAPVNTTARTNSSRFILTRSGIRSGAGIRCKYDLQRILRSMPFRCGGSLGWRACCVDTNFELISNSCARDHWSHHRHLSLDCRKCWITTKPLNLRKRGKSSRCRVVETWTNHTGSVTPRRNFVSERVHSAKHALHTM